MSVRVSLLLCPAIREGTHVREEGLPVADDVARLLGALQTRLAGVATRCDKWAWSPQLLDEVDLL